jgi:MtaA/CmuA family methyltransferase
VNSKERFLAVMDGKKPDKVPVFPLLMAFAARRYGATYRQFASDWRVLSESQLSIREKFKVDAITACSDAFRVSADLGGEIVFPEEQPPHLARPLIRTEGDLVHLKRQDISSGKGRMVDRIRATEAMTKAAGDDCMVLGWVDMPFAEACSACGVAEFLTMLYDEPTFAHRILEFLTDIVVEFAVAQVAAGAPMIGAGDAAASLISPGFFAEFALPYEKRVCNAVHAAGGTVKLHICGNTTQLLNEMVESGADLFNIDHMVDFTLAMNTYSAAGKAFKGNLDPVSDMLQSTPEECGKKAADLIKKAAGKKYMLSAGCEVPAEVSDDVFWAFCNASS